jgi:hypothetical protein
MVMGNNDIDINKKYASNAGNFYCHAYTAVQCGVHCLMEHILSFTKSHWMPPLGEWLHCIAAAATMVDDFDRKHKTLTKNYL